MEFGVEQLDHVLLLASSVLLVAILAVRLSAVAGLPSLLFYLLLGVALGSSGFGIQYDDAELSHALGFAALIVILAEGGLTTSWPEIRPAMRLGALLATVGVVAGVGVMTVGAHLLLGFDWRFSLLLAAVTAPTDAAAVFSVLRRVPLPRRLAGALEAESGLNDAPTVLLVTLASQGDVLDGHGGIVGVVALVVFELGVGALVGGVVGVGGAWVMRHAALPASGLYPLTALTMCVAAYAGAAALHTSGFAAVYTAALVLGNSELPHRGSIRSFLEGLGWLAQIGLFVLLGLLLTPDRLTWQNLWHALAAGALLTLVARPVAVALSAAAGRIRLPRHRAARSREPTLAELVFVWWAGLRGAVPIVLATIPLAAGVPGAATLFDIVFILVVIDTLVTAPTMPWLARRLGLSTPSAVRDLDVEVAPLDRIAADLLQVRITGRSRMHGVEVGELRLPEGASVALIVRNGSALVPEHRTALHRGDDILVVTPRRLREPTESRLQAVSRTGRLAGWLD